MRDRIQLMNFNTKNEFKFCKHKIDDSSATELESVKLKGNDISLCLELKFDNPDNLAGKMWHRRITGSKIFNINNLKK